MNQPPLSLTSKLFDLYLEHILHLPENTQGKVHLTVIATARAIADNPHMAPHLVDSPQLSPTGKIMVFNVSPLACRELTHHSDRITFLAKFKGVEHLNTVYYADMVGLSDPYNPNLYQLASLMLTTISPVSDHWSLCIVTPSDPESEEVAEPPKGRPTLKLVK